MPGASVCFNCKSRRTACVSQGDDGPSLQPHRRRESDSARHSSSPDVLGNSVTDQRAPFLAVLDPSGVSLSS